MSWETEITLLVRGYIGDMGSPPKYADADIQSFILTSAFMVTFDVWFKQEYDVDIEGGTLTPDPTSRDTATSRDTDFITLVVARCGAIVFNNEIRLYGSQDIAIKDGSSSIDLKRDLKTLLGLAATYDKKYSNLKQSFVRGDGNLGVAILSREMKNPYNNECAWNSDYWRTHAGYSYFCGVC